MNMYMNKLIDCQTLCLCRSVTQRSEVNDSFWKQFWEAAGRRFSIWHKMKWEKEQKKKAKTETWSPGSET